MTALLFIVGAAVGAVARHLVNTLGRGWRGTLAVNIAGSFALGMLVASEATDATTTVLGVGLLGSLTTFSTFSLEVAESPRSRRLGMVTATLVFGLVAAAVGHAVA